MKKIITSLFLLFVVTAVFGIETQTQVSEEGTKVIFYIENQIEQPEDYVQITIQIKSQHPSLQKAIDEADHIVKKVESIVKNYCESHSKNKKECQQVVETSQYKIDPIYQLVRKVPTFVAFSVSHQTVAKISQVKDIGKLADDILKSGVSKIGSFEWKPIKQVDNEEQAVSEGIELVNDICDQIGLQLGRIVAVSEVTDYQEEEQKQEAADQQEKQQQQQQQQDRQQESTVVYSMEKVKNENHESLMHEEYHLYV